MAKGNSLIVLLLFVKVSFLSLAQLISPLSSLVCFLNLFFTQKLINSNLFYNSTNSIT